MLMIELPTATPPLVMTAAYKETDVTIRIRSNRYYSAEYRIAVHPTIRSRSEYEANIRYSPSYNQHFLISTLRPVTPKSACPIGIFISILPPPGIESAF